MPNRQQFSIALVGAFGGSAPILLRVAMDLSDQRATIGNFSPSFFVGLALYGFLGAGLAAIWQELDLKKVFYIGLGLPSLITVAAANRNPAQDASFLPDFVPSVLAAEQAGKAQTLTLQLPPEAEGVILTVSFDVAGSNDDVEFQVAGHETVELLVPPSAQSLRINSRVVYSGVLKLQNSPNAATMKLRAEKNPWRGFWYAVGVPSRLYKLVPVETGK